MEQPFYCQSIRKSSPYYKFAFDFLKANKIKYRVVWGSWWWGGWALSDQSKIVLKLGERDTGSNDPISIQKFLSLVFHEASHVLAYRDGKFMGYHSVSKRWTRTKYKTVIRLAVRAELYTDWRAKQLMKKHFPNIPFHHCYDDYGVARFKRNSVAAWKFDLANMEKRYRKRK